MAGIGANAKYIGFTVPKQEFNVLLGVANGDTSSVARLIKRFYLVGLQAEFPLAAEQIKRIREEYSTSTSNKRRDAASQRMSGVRAAQKANVIDPTEDDVKTALGKAMDRAERKEPQKPESGEQRTPSHERTSPTNPPPLASEDRPSSKGGRKHRGKK